MSWLEEEQDRSHDGGMLWLIEFMKEGGLSRGPMPQHKFTFNGLQRALAGLIGLSRQWAVRQGLSKRRSFNRSREGDAHGYMLNDTYEWWDHPGNSGY